MIWILFVILHSSESVLRLCGYCCACTRNSYIHVVESYCTLEIVEIVQVTEMYPFVVPAIEQTLLT